MLAKRKTAASRHPSTVSEAVRALQARKELLAAPAESREVTIKTVGHLLELDGATLTLWDPDVGLLGFRDIVSHGGLWDDADEARPGDRIWVSLRAGCLPTFKGMYRGCPCFKVEVLAGRLKVVARPETPPPIVRWWDRDRGDDR
jgi:hypothetical protein